MVDTFYQSVQMLNVDFEMAVGVLLSLKFTGFRATMLKL